MRGLHSSATISVEGDVSQTGRNIITCNCIQWIKKSMPVNETTIELAGLVKFTETVGKIFATAVEKATNVMRTPERALEIGAKLVVHW